MSTENAKKNAGKWKTPRRVGPRRSLLRRCSSRCFLEPYSHDPRRPNYPKFPICTQDCHVSAEGLRAAERRAHIAKARAPARRKSHYEGILKKAQRRKRQIGMKMHPLQHKERGGGYYPYYPLSSSSSSSSSSYSPSSSSSSSYSYSS